MSKSEGSKRLGGPDPTAKRLAELEGRHRVLLKESEDLEEQLEEAQEFIKKLESSRSVLRSELDKLQKSGGGDVPPDAAAPAVQDHALVNQQLRDENLRLINANNELAAELSDAEDDRKGLEEELAASLMNLNETQEAWEAAFKKLQGEVSAQAEELERATRDLDEAREAHASVADEHASLKESHDSLRAGILKKVEQQFPEKALPADFDLAQFAELIDSFAKDAAELGTLRALKDSFEARERKLTALENHAKSKLETIQERLDSVNRTRSTLIAVINEFVSAIDPKNAKRLHLAETFTYADLTQVMAWLSEARTRLGKFKSAFGMAQKI